MKKSLLVAAVLCLASLAVSAFDTTAFQLSLWAPRAQLVPPEIAISGLKINLPYGNNSKVTGLDLGLVSVNREQDSKLDAQVSALQINLWNSTNGKFGGLQVGLVNLADNAAGIQIGLYNSTDNMFRGVHAGLVNISMEVHGLEIGLVNYTEFMTGVQLGLINIITKSSVPFLPLFNLCF